GEHSEREQALVERAPHAADGDRRAFDEEDDDRRKGAHGDLRDEMAVAESDETEEAGDGQRKRSDLELGVVGVEVQAAREIHPARVATNEEVAAADEVVPVASLHGRPREEAQKREAAEQEVPAAQDGVEPHLLPIGTAFRALK